MTETAAKKSRQYASLLIRRIPPNFQIAAIKGGNRTFIDTAFRTTFFFGSISVSSYGKLCPTPAIAFEPLVPSSYLLRTFYNVHESPHMAESYTVLALQRKPHARVPPPTLARIATRQLRSTRRCRACACAAAPSGAGGPPASPSPSLVVAVYDEHLNCAPPRKIRRRHGGQQWGDRGARVGLSRGNGPDGRNRPRGCRLCRQATAAPIEPSAASGHAARAPRPTRPAVRAGANVRRLRRPLCASLRPPEGGAGPPPCWLTLKRTISHRR